MALVALDDAVSGEQLCTAASLGAPAFNRGVDSVWLALGTPSRSSMESPPMTTSCGYSARSFPLLRWPMLRRYRQELRRLATSR